MIAYTALYMIVPIFYYQWYMLSAAYFVFMVHSYQKSRPNNYLFDFNTLMRMYFWPLNKLLSPFKTDGGMLSKQLAKIEAAIQPETLMVENIYSVKNTEDIIIRTVGNDKVLLNMFVLKISDVKFTRLASERDAIEGPKLQIFGDTMTLEAVLNPEHYPVKVSEYLNSLINGGQVGGEECLTDKDQKKSNENERNK